jgi:lantibiotic modifying enzyme
MEYVEHLPCQNMWEVRRYYQRAGGLICLLSLLGTANSHIENFIANGEHPVAVDVEVYRLPPLLDFSPQKTLSGNVTGGNRFIEHMVLSWGLLAGSMSSPCAREVIDLSALGDLTVQGQVSSRGWMHMNTDAMSLSEGMTERQMGMNEVVLDGVTIRSGDYSEEIISGFRCMYSFLLEHWDELLAPEGPLARFAGCSIRIVWRATATYAKLLKRLTHPKFLRDGAERWIELCTWQKLLRREEALPGSWRLIEAEVTSLERLDVPFFSTRTDCLDLWTDGGIKYVGVFARSVQEERRLFFMRLSEEDMEHRIGIIRELLCSSTRAR